MVILTGKIDENNRISVHLLGGTLRRLYVPQDRQSYCVLESQKQGDEVT